MKQQALRLRYTGWGGRREGAGRKSGSDPRIRHASRESFPRGVPCHVTLKVEEGVPSLRSVRLVQELEQSWGTASDRGDFRLVHYSLQANHVHLIVEATDAAALGRGMKAIGARLARAANRVFGRRGRVLADRYHMRTLRTPREVRNALRYVLLNARRHARKARGKRLDPASSARWFDGWRLGGVPSADEPAVAEARTWLLRKGWRRYGLLDPAEVPGPG